VFVIQCRPFNFRGPPCHHEVFSFREIKTCRSSPVSNCVERMGMERSIQMLSTVPAEGTWYVRSQARGRSIPSNTCAIEDYEWDYGQVQSSALPRTQPSPDPSQLLPNDYPDQTESNYTTAPSVGGITQGMAQTTLGTSSSSAQQPMLNKAPWSTSSAPSNYIKTRDLSTDSEPFDHRECPVARLHFGGHCPDIW
jgi:hypothetical protein